MISAQRKKNQPLPKIRPKKKRQLAKKLILYSDSSSSSDENEQLHEANAPVTSTTETRVPVTLDSKTNPAPTPVAEITNSQKGNDIMTKILYTSFSTER